MKIESDDPMVRRWAQQEILSKALSDYRRIKQLATTAEAAAILGRKGGKSTSKAKQDAAKKNGKKGGRPKKKIE